MWCPSVSLSVWANAWLAGHAAPDDVLDALSAWAPAHSVAAHDAIAAGRTGLPWPEGADNSGLMSLLQTVRAAAGRGPAADAWARRPAIGVVEPLPGDVRGLIPGTRFAEDALAAGEAVVVGRPGGEAVGLIPAFEGDASEYEDADPDAPVDADVLSWSAHALPDVPTLDQIDLGEAEYALRTAVRDAAEILGVLELPVSAGADPRAMIEEVLQATDRHRVPEHAPPRSVRVLSTAAHVQAILTVGAGLAPRGARSASEARIADTALQPLSAVVRRARAAAVDAILQSAWRD